MTRPLHFPDDAPVNVARLSGLSSEALYALAEKMGLDLPIDLEKVFIVEALLEAWEEDRADHDDAAGTTTSVEAQKFAGPEPDEIDSINFDTLHLEPRYNETVVHVIPRDPSWAYVFWDVRNDERETLQATEGFCCMFLRVVKEPHGDGKGTFSFEVVVGPDDDHWYLHLPDENTVYRVDLYARSGSKVRLLAHSPQMRTPRASIAEPASQLEPATEALAGLSGLASLRIEMAPSHHPTRILGGSDD